MKKIIVGIFSFALLFAAQNAFAANWNGESSDCQNTIAIANYTSNTGYGSCWTSTSMSAEPGDTINVRIYYHNTSNVVAKNVRLAVTKSSNTSTSHNFMGRIMSDNGDVSGNVNLTISSPKSLEFVDARWFPNQSRSLSALPNGQSASSILSSGILIGDVAPGWESQGTMVAVFKVSSVVVPPPTCQDSSATNYLGSLPCTYPQLCKDVNANNYNKTLPCTYPPQLCRDTSATNYLDALPCTYPQVCKDYNANNYGRPLLCTYPAQLCKDTSATNYLGSLPCTYPQLCKDVNANNYNQTLPCTYNTVITLQYFNVIAYNQSGHGQINNSTAWKVTSSVEYGKTTIFNLTPDDGYVTDRIHYPAVSSCRVGTLNGNTYTTGTITEFCVFYVYFKKAPINTYNLTINKVGTGTGTVTGGGTYNSGTTITATASPSGDSKFSGWSGDCNSSGQVVMTTNRTCTATFTKNIVTPTPPIICQDYNANNYGRTGGCTYTKIVNTILNTISNNNNTTTTNNSTSTNNSVTNSNNNNSVNNSNNTTKTVNITTGGTSNPIRCLDQSASNYLAYSSCVYYNYNNQIRCLDASASNYLEYNSCIYNQIRCLDASASNYLAYSSCIYNQVRCLDTSATNYLAYNSCIYNTYVNKNVVTTVATNITRNEAQINGYITNTTYYNSNVYFNYGTTVNLGSRTQSKTANGNSSFSDFLTGLNPNTIYFFQAVGDGLGGISKGNIEVFKTLGNAVVTPVIVQGTTIIGKASPVLLNISNKYQLISAGDLVDYIVTYKNIGNTRLVRPMVQVVIPMNMTLVNSSRGTYSVDTHTLSAPVEDLNPGQEGVIYLQAKVDSIPLNNSQIVTTALLVYTNTNGAQENAMAYVFNEPSAMGGAVAGDASVLGASAFFGGFLSIGLIGWMLILLLVLIIILISRSYSKNNTSSESKTVTHTTTLQ